MVVQYINLRPETPRRRCAWAECMGRPDKAEKLLAAQMRAEGIYTEPLVFGSAIPSGA